MGNLVVRTNDKDLIAAVWKWYADARTAVSASNQGMEQSAVQMQSEEQSWMQLLGFTANTKVIASLHIGESKVMDAAVKKAITDEEKIQLQKFRKIYYLCERYIQDNQQRYVGAANLADLSHGKAFLILLIQHLSGQAILQPSKRDAYQVRIQQMLREAFSYKNGKITETSSNNNKYVTCHRTLTKVSTTLSNLSKIKEQKNDNIFEKFKEHVKNINQQVESTLEESLKLLLTMAVDIEDKALLQAVKNPNDCSDTLKAEIGNNEVIQLLRFQASSTGNKVVELYQGSNALQLSAEYSSVFLKTCPAARETLVESIKRYKKIEALQSLLKTLSTEIDSQGAGMFRANARYYETVVYDLYCQVDELNGLNLELIKQGTKIAIDGSGTPTWRSKFSAEAQSQQAVGDLLSQAHKMLEEIDRAAVCLIPTFTRKLAENAAQNNTEITTACESLYGLKNEISEKATAQLIEKSEEQEISAHRHQLRKSRQDLMDKHDKLIALVKDSKTLGKDRQENLVRLLESEKKTVMKSSVILSEPGKNDAEAIIGQFEVLDFSKSSTFADLVESQLSLSVLIQQQDTLKQQQQETLRNFQSANDKTALAQVKKEGERLSSKYDALIKRVTTSASIKDDEKNKILDELRKRQQDLTKDSELPGGANDITDQHQELNASSMFIEKIEADLFNTLGKENKTLRETLEMTDGKKTSDVKGKCSKQHDRMLVIKRMASDLGVGKQSVHSKIQKVLDDLNKIVKSSGAINKLDIYDVQSRVLEAKLIGKELEQLVEARASLKEIEARQQALVEANDNAQQVQHNHFVIQDNLHGKPQSRLRKPLAVFSVAATAFAVLSGLVAVVIIVAIAVPSPIQPIAMAAGGPLLAGLAEASIPVLLTALMPAIALIASGVVGQVASWMNAKDVKAKERQCDRKMRMTEVTRNFNEDNIVNSRVGYLSEMQTIEKGRECAPIIKNGRITFSRQESRLSVLSKLIVSLEKKFKTATKTILGAGSSKQTIESEEEQQDDGYSVAGNPATWFASSPSRQLATPDNDLLPAVIKFRKNQRVKEVEMLQKEGKQQTSDKEISLSY